MLNIQLMPNIIMKRTQKGGGSHASRVSTYLWISDFTISRRVFLQKKTTEVETRPLVVVNSYSTDSTGRREQRMGLVVTALIGIAILIGIGIKTAFFTSEYPDGEKIPWKVRILMIIIALPMIIVIILAFLRVI
jgi:ABC-type phosphate transport system permease subunit